VQLGALATIKYNGAVSSTQYPEVEASGYRCTPYFGGGWAVAGIIGPDTSTANVWNYYQSIKLSGFNNAANKVAIFDASNGEAYPGFFMAASAPYGNSPGFAINAGAYVGGANGDRSNPLLYSPPHYIPNVGFVHNQQANVALLDGHVEGFRSKDLLNDPTDSRWAPWK
jgi:prepilin-type processing-associated H-X9-DG protein